MRQFSKLLTGSGHCSWQQECNDRNKSQSSQRANLSELREKQLNSVMINSGQ